jgi:hypothetical protein
MELNSSTSKHKAYDPALLPRFQNRRLAAFARIVKALPTGTRRERTFYRKAYDLLCELGFGRPDRDEADEIEMELDGHLNSI